MNNELQGIKESPNVLMYLKGNTVRTGYHVEYSYYYYYYYNYYNYYYYFYFFFF